MKLPSTLERVLQKRIRYIDDIPVNDTGILYKYSENESIIKFSDSRWAYFLDGVLVTDSPSVQVLRHAELITAADVIECETIALAEFVTILESQKLSHILQKQITNCADIYGMLKGVSICNDESLLLVFEDGRFAHFSTIVPSVSTVEQLELDIFEPHSNILNVYYEFMEI